MMNQMPDMNTFRNLGKTVIYILKMPWNGMVKNLHDDMRSGSANIMWKYPLAAGLAGYPFGFYYHESKTFCVGKYLQALDNQNKSCLSKIVNSLAS